MNRLLFGIGAACIPVILLGAGSAQSGSSTIHTPGQAATTVKVSPSGDGGYKIETPGQSATIVRVSPSIDGGGNTIVTSAPITEDAGGGSGAIQTPGQMPAPARTNLGGASTKETPGQMPTVIRPNAGGTSTNETPGQMPMVIRPNLG